MCYYSKNVHERGPDIVGLREEMNAQLRAIGIFTGNSANEHIVIVSKGGPVGAAENYTACVFTGTPPNGEDAIASSTSASTTTPAPPFSLSVDLSAGKYEISSYGLSSSITTQKQTVAQGSRLTAVMQTTRCQAVEEALRQLLEGTSVVLEKMFEAELSELELGWDEIVGDGVVIGPEISKLMRKG